MAPSRRKQKRIRRDSKSKSIVDGKQTKKVRQESSTGGTDNQTICWQFSRIDWDGPWGSAALTGVNIVDLLKSTIAKWETMTWAAIYAASGGKSKGNNHHPIEVSGLSKKAKDRLKQIKYSDFDSVISLRVNSTVRIYGIRNQRALQFLWYDPWHDDRNNAVCPSLKRS